MKGDGCVTKSEDTIQYRDRQGGLIPGQFFDTETGRYRVVSIEGETVEGVNWGKQSLYRDRQGGILPQRWSNELGRFVILTDDMFVGGGGDGGPVTWGSIVGKPTEFKPSQHTHDISDVNGLQTELTNHNIRIQNLEDEIPDDIVDGETIITENGKLVAKSIAGAEVTTDEINKLKGVTENVQAQINALNSVGNFSTTVDTYAELSGLNVSNNDMVIVLEDETKNGSSTIYIYNGNEYVFAGEFKAGEMRDFVLNPINLATETTDILPKSRYEKQNASETAFTDNTGKITATNVQDAIKQVYQRAEQNTGGGSGYVSWSNITGKPSTFPSTIAQVQGLQEQLDTVFTQVSSGKLSLETAIETKGVKVNKSSDIATFDELRMAILAIVTGTGESTGNDLRMAIDDVISIDFQQPTATNPTEYINYPTTNVADSVTVTLQEV